MNHEQFDNFETKKLKFELIESIFQGSKILKRQTDKVLMYYNLPPYILENLFYATKLFPSSEASQKEGRLPQSSKIIQYFDGNSQKEIPNLILLELESDQFNGSERFVLGAFSPNSWSKKRIV